MKQIYRQALVPYSTERMYDLVNTVPNYPNFLPWCKNAQVLEQSDREIKASLVLSKGGIQKSFTTRNILTPHKIIKIELIDGPFKHLSGEWRFAEKIENQTLVSVNLEFEFSSKMLTMLLGPVFDEVAQTLVDAFVQEAHRQFSKP